jgi:hypothetical protein
VSRTLSSGLVMLTAALIDHQLRAAGLEHRTRFVASGDDRLDIVEVEGGIPAGIRLRGGRYGVVRYHRDDEGEVWSIEECGWFKTPGEVAARVVAVLRGAAGAGGG